MKIRHIEFDEKLLSKVDGGRSTYPTVTQKIAAQWYITLIFRITDDFNFTHQESKSIQYTEFDFEDSKAMDDYIEVLMDKLNKIILNDCPISDGTK